jgi:hypothetical protein
MKLRLTGAGLLAALHASVAWSQAPAGTPPPREHSTRPQAAVVDSKSSQPSSPAGAAYRSPFADYRGFRGDEPLVDWRRANDQVRDAGGHVGLMKEGGGAKAPPEGHGAHGTMHGPAKDARR